MLEFLGNASFDGGQSSSSSSNNIDTNNWTQLGLNLTQSGGKICVRAQKKILTMFLETMSRKAIVWCLNKKIVKFQLSY